MISRFAVRNFATASKKKVGFMGLGNMGLSMVRNCMKHGYEITAYDVNHEVLKLAEKEGVKIATDVKGAVTDQDICFTMLPNTEIVEKIRTGKGGIFEHAREGCLVIDSSTISPIASKAMAEAGKKLGLVIADAPVSGGTVGATNGTLTFMVGSDKEYYNQIQEFLKSMGTNIFHCGGPGTGQISKICNNLMLGIQMIAVSEGMALGEKLGMDPKVLANIVSTSTGSCWANNVYNPRPGVIEGVPSSKNYDGGFMVSLMRKDLGIVLESASKVGLDLQFGQKANDYYLELEK